MTLSPTSTFPDFLVPGSREYWIAMASCIMPHAMRPAIMKRRRRPYLVMRRLLASKAAVPTPFKIQEFSKGFPTLAISKKYVPYAI